MFTVGKNEGSISKFQHLFKADHSRYSIGPARVSPRVPVAFVVDLLVLHWEHAHVMMCDYGGLGQQMNGKSSLRIICTYRHCSNSGHVSDALGKTKERC